MDFLALPRADLIDWRPEWAGWGLVHILKTCDRRIGARVWPAPRESITQPAARRRPDLRAGPRPSSGFPLAGRDVDQTHDPRWAPSRCKRPTPREDHHRSSILGALRAGRLFDGAEPLQLENFSRLASSGYRGEAGDQGGPV